MAAKQATVYIIDVGNSMGLKRLNTETTYLQDALAVVTGMIGDKVLAERKTDKVGVVLCGTEETDHPLAEEDQYQHIKLLYSISQPDISLMRKLSNEVKSEDAYGDVLDALIVGINTITDHCKHYKFMKRIILFTDAEAPINSDDMDVVAQKIVNEGIELLVVGADFDDPETGLKYEDKSETKRENEKLIRKLLTATESASLIPMSQALSEVQLPRSKKVIKPTTTFRPDLTLGDPNDHPDTALCIPVYIYSRTSELKPQTAKKYSALSDTANIENKTHQVTMSRVYKLKKTGEDVLEDSGEGEDVEIPAEDVEHAYQYGKTLVPIKKVDEDVLKLHTIKSLQILGFFLLSLLPRDYLISNVYTVLPEPDAERSHIALSAFGHALQEKSACALVRFVQSTDKAPKLGVLVPWFDVGREGLYLAQIPFAEDVRRYGFASLERVTTVSGRSVNEHKNLPTEEMLDKVGEFIEEMDLMKIETDEDGNPVEYLAPENTYNPGVNRINRAISMRALDPAAPVPDVLDTLKRQMGQPDELKEKNRDIVEVMKQLFDVKKVPPKTKKRGYGAATSADAASSTTATAGDITNSLLDNPALKRTRTDNSSDDVTVMSMKNLTEQQITNVGTIDPVGDFTAMVNNRTVDLVSAAVTQMSEVIKQLVTMSFGDQFYEKAIECLMELRRVAAIQNESEAFNTFLYELRSICVGKRRADFWDLLVKRNLTLISKDEAADSNVEVTDANKFLQAGELTDVDMGQEKDAVDADDLLNMME